MIETERLVLRPWRDEDRAPFAELNADPQVMRYFPAPLSREESDAVVDRLITRHAEHGFTFAPAERKADALFLGFVGLTRTEVGQSFDGAPEIGWRLRREAWGQGYASEAAGAWLDWAWANLPGEEEVVSFTASTNEPSRRVMQRIGMTRRPDLDFDHPSVPDGHALKPHIVYSIGRP